MKNTTVRGIIPLEIKEDAKKVLDKEGISITDAINDLFHYIAQNKDYPFKSTKEVEFKK